MESIDIPDSVETLDLYVFYGCTAFKEFTLDKNICELEGTIKNCSGLAKVVISDIVTTIGDSAFSNCAELATVIITESVKIIGEKAFWRGYSFESLNISK